MKIRLDRCASRAVVFAVVSAPAFAQTDPPTITDQPRSQAVCSGTDVTFSVVATGAQLAYQWFKDNEAIAGATSVSYSIVQSDPLLDLGDYFVEVSNPWGLVASDAARLTVDAGPVIRTQPASARVCAGQAYTLSVEMQAGGATSTSESVGATTNSGSGPRLRGNYYHVTAATTLTRIEHYLNISTTGEIIFFVYQADALNGPYALVSEERLLDSGVGERFYSSSPLAVPLIQDKYYIIGAAWAGSHTYYFASGRHPSTFAFGTSIRGFQAGLSDPLPDPPPVNSSAFAHYQRLTTSQLVQTFQWEKDNEPIAGATGSEYAILSAADSDTGGYQVAITNQCGSTLSDIATVSVDPALTIDQQPSDQTACVGGDVSFSVVASGMTPTYQWRMDGVDLAGETAATLALTNVQPTDAAVYDVVISNDCNAPVTSEAAQLSVTTDPPVITQQPLTQTVCEGAPLTLSVAADGVGLSYQWRKDGVDEPNETASQFTINSISRFDVDTIGSTDNALSGSAMRGNGYAITRDTTLTCIEQYLDISASGPITFFVYEADSSAGPHTLVAQDRVDDPGSGERYYSSNALSVPLVAGKFYLIGAAWPGNHRYFWGGAHPRTTAFGATVAAGVDLPYADPLPANPLNASLLVHVQRLTTDPPPPLYDVVVSNACGQVISDAVSPTVATPISIVQQPTVGPTCEGDTVALSVSALGEEITYQWRLDGVELPDESAATLTLVAVEPNDGGAYDVVLTNACGSITSDAATLAVGTAPAIAQQPRPISVRKGKPFTLSVALDAGSDPTTVDTIGTSDSVFTSDVIRANCYAVTTSTTLTRIEQYLDIPSSSLLRFFVYEADSADGPWSLLLEDDVQQSGTGERFHASNPLSVSLSAGKFYLIGAAWPNNQITYFWGGAHPQTTSFGQTVSGKGFATIYLDPLPDDPINASSLVHTQRLTTTDDSVSFQWRRDGVDLPGATADSFSVQAAVIADGGVYDVNITNACGTLRSEPVRVVVWDPTTPGGTPTGTRAGDSAPEEIIP